MLRLLAIVLCAAVPATSQNLVTAVRSPYTLAKYVEAHNDFDWDEMAKVLGIANENIFLPPCERANKTHVPCAAHIIDIASPRQAILVLTHEDSFFRSFSGTEAFQATSGG